MEKTLTPLLIQLAEQLNTTTEYLWGVLINQAYISAWISVLYTILNLIFGVCLYLAHKKFSVEIDGQNMYYKNDSLELIMVLLLIVWCIWALAVICGCIPNAIIGFFSPEYWAMERVFDLLN